MAVGGQESMIPEEKKSQQGWQRAYILIITQQQRRAHWEWQKSFSPSKQASSVSQIPLRKPHFLIQNCTNLARIFKYMSHLWGGQSHSNHQSFSQKHCDPAFPIFFMLLIPNIFYVTYCFQFPCFVFCNQMQSPVHVKLCHRICLNEISPLKKYTYFSLKRNELIELIDIHYSECLTPSTSYVSTLVL